ncbi:MAG: methionine--tRNA ligase subunit beta [Nanoarchaeota archaeon]
MTEGIKNIAEFSDWEKIDLRVAEIINVEEIENADKLWKLTIDVGELGGGKSAISPDSSSGKNPNQRTICAGIKQFYSKKELKGKKIIYFSNLKSRKLKGIESQGMLLAASNEEHSKVVLISPEKDIDNGSRIG